MKTCTICGRSFPATTEYFYRHGQKKDGLNSWCIECQRVKSRDQYEKHRVKRLEHAQNRRNGAGREKVLRSKRDYHNRNREEILKRRRILRNENRDKINARKREQYQLNPHHQRQKSREYIQANPERNRVKVQQWRKKNPDKKQMHSVNRRAKMRSLPASFTAEDWQRLLKDFQHRCAVCDSASPLTADHWIPVSSSDCPGTVPGNIIPLCQSCNSSKSNNHPKEWLINRYGDHGKRLYALIAHYLSEV